MISIAITTIAVGGRVGSVASPSDVVFLVMMLAIAGVVVVVCATLIVGVVAKTCCSRIICNDVVSSCTYSAPVWDDIRTTATGRPKSADAAELRGICQFLTDDMKSFCFCSCCCCRWIRPFRVPLTPMSLMLTAQKI